MIFLSHNYKDKPVVEQVALRLKSIYGIDKVFYDSLTNKYIIQDIKTYAVEVEKEKLATPLQFVIYMLAVEKLYNCAEAQISCQYYLPFCDCTQDAGTNGFINRGILKIDNIFQKIKTADFTPNPKKVNR